MTADRFRFTKDQRLLKPDQFTAVIKRGKYAADGLLVVSVLANDLQHSRLGVTIPRRTGSAVVRNRWKRLVREAFRLNQHDLPQGFDIVVRPKKDAEPERSRVSASLPRLVQLAVRRSRRT